MEKKFDLIDPNQLKVTVVLPAYHDVYKLPFTLESLCVQTHRKLDCILLVKEPVEELHSLVSTWAHQMNLQIYTLKTTSLARAYNRGVMLASGDYLQLMVPGDRYLSARSLSKMVEVALESFLPDMVFMGTLQSHENRPSTLWYNRYETSRLKKGVAPTKLSACLIRRDCLLEEGKLEDYHDEIAHLDWFCRMRSLAGFQFVCEEYYAIESQTRELSAKDRMFALAQMRQVIYRHFGLVSAVSSWMSHKPLSHLIKWMVEKQKVRTGSNVFSLHSAP
jgi:hypothetical protein